MSDGKLDRSFVEEQKQRLLELKAQFQRVRDGMEEDQRYRAEEEEDFTQHNSGDISQSLFTRQVDAPIQCQAERRLEYVDLALHKIDDGTHVICEDTGEPIPKGRLEAVPEATRTVGAQSSETTRRTATEGVRSSRR